MKRDWILPVGSLIFLLALIGGLALQPVVGQAFVVGVRYDPARIDLHEPDPAYINATLDFPTGYSVSDINASTILLEGTVPSETSLNYVIDAKFNKYYAVFDGTAVVNIIWVKLYHMGVVDPTVHKPFKVYLTITGNLNDSAGGTQFTGTGYIAVKIYSSTPPPPPP